MTAFGAVYFLLVMVGCVRNAEIPSYVTLCKRSDPQFNRCYEKSFDEMVVRSSPGIPELGLRQIDPYLFGSTKLRLGKEYEVSVMDYTVYGIGNTKARNAHYNVKTGNFEITNNIDKASATCKYRGKGKMLLFELDSSGQLTMNFTGVQTVMKGVGKLTQKDGQDYVQYDKLDTVLTIEKIRMYFGNFFPNEELTRNVNDAINANADLLYDQIIPVINDAFNEAMLDAHNHIFSKYSMQQLFPE